MSTDAKRPMRFKTTGKSDVPHSRHGKHRGFVSLILADLDRLKDGTALKIPLAELPDRKENIRSALNRATRKANRKIATAADDGFLYIWNLTM
jgi:hypothetical protein